MSEKLMAYCLKTKQKEEMLEPVVSLTKRGGYIVKGVTAEGNKMAKILSKENAENLISEGIAKKDY